MSEYDIEVHSAEVRGTPLELVVLSTEQGVFELLPAFHALTFDDQCRIMAGVADELRTLATAVEDQLAQTNDQP